jgi:hypothetical protein
MADSVHGLAGAGFRSQMNQHVLRIERLPAKLLIANISTEQADAVAQIGWQVVVIAVNLGAEVIEN